MENGDHQMSVTTAETTEVRKEGVGAG